MKRLDIIIPFLNEEENIPVLVDKLNQQFQTGVPYTPHVIFVDDGSTDGSVNALIHSSPTFSCEVIQLAKNFGSHAALRAGIMHGSGDYTTFLYADLQDPPNLPTLLFEQAEQGHEIVWAVRKTTQSGFFESFFSRMYARLMKRFVSPSFPEKGFDVALFNREVSELLNQNQELNSSIFLQILTLGFNQQTIEYDKEARRRGRSKWTLSKKINLFIDSFVAFSHLPLRLVSTTGILFFLTGISWSIYLIFRKLTYNDLNQGWPALACILMVGFGITFVFLGIIAEYLWRTLDASRHRPAYIVHNTRTIKSD